ncbi:MAG: indolepyruvate oxidoreductase subunit beta [Candidatus Cloacimonetes bacterium]|nr:indolepyruvate oxidoreductase subunit beta [Candidatus Cloacimonadota bacterium]
MKKDIILAGVGGQGILSIAAIIGYAAVESGMHLKQAEVHGMSQRGGDVQSHLRISDDPIHSDLVALGGADMILSVEPMEGLRYNPYLSEAGWFITNTTPFVNIPNYPDIEAVLSEVKAHERRVMLDADSIAKELGNARGMNMVMLGAASQFIDLPQQKFEDGVRFLFGRKGDKIVNLNLDAFRKGRALAAEVG